MKRKGKATEADDGGGSPREGRTTRQRKMDRADKGIHREFTFGDTCLFGDG